MIILLFPMMNFVQRGVEEKQNKTREAMRMMGMMDSAYFSSWLLFYALQALWVSIIICAILVLGVTSNINFLILFLVVFLYAFSLFGYILTFIAMF